MEGSDRWKLNGIQFSLFEGSRPLQGSPLQGSPLQGSSPAASRIEYMGLRSPCGHQNLGSFLVEMGDGVLPQCPRLTCGDTGDILLRAVLNTCKQAERQRP